MIFTFVLFSPPHNSFHVNDIGCGLDFPNTSSVEWRLRSTRHNTAVGIKIVYLVLWDKLPPEWRYGSMRHYTREVIKLRWLPHPQWKISEKINGILYYIIILLLLLLLCYNLSLPLFPPGLSNIIGVIVYISAALSDISPKKDEDKINNVLKLTNESLLSNIG